MKGDRIKQLKVRQRPLLLRRRSKRAGLDDAGNESHVPRRSSTEAPQLRLVN